MWCKHFFSYFCLFIWKKYTCICYMSACKKYVILKIYKNRNRKNYIGKDNTFSYSLTWENSLSKAGNFFWPARYTLLLLSHFYFSILISLFYIPTNLFFSKKCKLSQWILRQNSINKMIFISTTLYGPFILQILNIIKNKI